MIQIPECFASALLRQPETGMDYQIATVTLNDGRIFPQAVLSSGLITHIRGYTKVPFTSEEMASIAVTHDKWNFQEDRPS
jgi:hypothetical protein